MTNEDKNIPVDDEVERAQDSTNGSGDEPTGEGPVAEEATPPAPAGDTRDLNEEHSGDPQMDQRLERLGGEPAPVITPEEFARLQKAGQVHIDSRGRVRTSRPSSAEAGVSLRKRRAWY
jgi:hypothetical protein